MEKWRKDDKKPNARTASAVITARAAIPDAKINVTARHRVENVHASLAPIWQLYNSISLKFE
ncbi:hypothetical protein G5I_06954 [Acromyrmex echinatior]|uniref:Uncharacterized protein n=1 Tax=Acromyrmex echinatior TaxID=103372 RepID=F4WMC0_ACREC|nr:hypothetical protein G5I_06954 [Acromyrmex echinatior]